MVNSVVSFAVAVLFSVECEGSLCLHAGFEELADAAQEHEDTCDQVDDATANKRPD